MYTVNAIVRPGDGMQLQTRSLQHAIDSLAAEAVLVKVAVAGVCHTDLHLCQGFYKVCCPKPHYH